VAAAAAVWEWVLSGERGLGSGAEAAAAVQEGMGSAAKLCELGTPPRTAQSFAGGRWQSAATESKKNEESNIYLNYVLWSVPDSDTKILWPKN
jgi:hypothetical protein